MTQSEEITFLKEQVNNLIMELAANKAKTDLLEDAFLDNLRCSKPKEYPVMYTNYVDFLEKKQTRYINTVKSLLLDTNDQGFWGRKSFELFQALQAMKREASYQKNEDDSK